MMNKLVALVKDIDQLGVKTFLIALIEECAGFEDRIQALESECRRLRERLDRTSGVTERKGSTNDFSIG